MPSSSSTYGHDENQLSDGSDSGTNLGQSTTDKIGFYGTTPVTRYAAVGAASTYVQYQQSTASASTWGFSSEAAVTSLVHQVSTLTVALRNLGLIT